MGGKLFARGLIISLQILSSSCTKTKAKMQEPPAPVETCAPHYLTEIRPFIISRCAVSNCHVANFPFGNFDSYDDLKKRIDNGRLQTLVFEQKLMPPPGAIQLTEQELSLLKCWMDNGAPEN
jgi:hypothetical protein